MSQSHLIHAQTFPVTFLKKIPLQALLHEICTSTYRGMELRLELVVMQDLNELTAEVEENLCTQYPAQ